MKITAIASAFNRGTYFAVALSNIICGYAVANLGQRYAYYFHIKSGIRDAARHVTYRDDYPLPGGTLLVMPYVSSNAPIYLGYLIGLSSLALLLLLDRGGTNRTMWIPACMAVTILLGFVPLIYIALAMSLPFSFLSN